MPVAPTIAHSLGCGTQLALPRFAARGLSRSLEHSRFNLGTLSLSNCRGIGIHKSNGTAKYTLQASGEERVFCFIIGHHVRVVACQSESRATCRSPSRCLIAGHIICFFSEALFSFLAYNDCIVVLTNTLSAVYDDTGINPVLTKNCYLYFFIFVLACYFELQYHYRLARGICMAPTDPPSTLRMTPVHQDPALDEK